MHFDDRLATVLRLRAGGAVVARTQYRQLLDLLGTLPADARSDQIDAGYLRLDELSHSIPVADRAAAFNDLALRLRSPRLVASLCASEPAVATGAVARAQLSEEQWLDLIPVLPVAVRGIVRHRRDLGERVEALFQRLGVRDRGLPDAASSAVAPADEPVPETSGSPEIPLMEDSSPDGIGAIVRRIEAFRRNRQPGEGSAKDGVSPRLPLGEAEVRREEPPLHAFDFSVDARGRIGWADPGVAAMVVGLHLLGGDRDGPVEASDAVHALFSRRLPIRAGQIAVSGAPGIAGDWQIDAAPFFDPLSGGFAGYHGRMRRPQAPVPAPPVPPPPSEEDRIRQVLHELRTPVNAIQGFAEIIQQQLFGPTPHEYRALAAGIAADSARILAGFDELDRLAKLGSGAMQLDEGACDLAEIVASAVFQLEAYTGPRGGGFTLAADEGELAIALDRPEAERMAWRLLATLASAAAPGEVLALKLRRRNANIRLSAHLPAQLAGRSDDELFEAAAPSGGSALSSSMFGSGFALRLLATEARSAGGKLERRNDRLRLTLPGLTKSSATHSDDGLRTG